jgi:hypothetical protein
VLVCWWFWRNWHGWHWYPVPLTGILLAGIGTTIWAILNNLPQLDRMSLWLWYTVAGLAAWVTLNDCLRNGLFDGEILLNSLLVSAIPLILFAFAQVYDLLLKGNSFADTLWLRIPATLLNANNLAAILVPVITTTANRIATTRASWGRYLLWIYLAVLLFTLILTLSRNGFIGSLLRIGLVVIYRRNLTRRFLLVFILVGGKF